MLQTGETKGSPTKEVWAVVTRVYTKGKRGGYAVTSPRVDNGSVPPDPSEGSITFSLSQVTDGKGVHAGELFVLDDIRMYDRGLRAHVAKRVPNNQQ